MRPLPARLKIIKFSNTGRNLRFFDFEKIRYLTEFSDFPGHETQKNCQIGISLTSMKRQIMIFECIFQLFQLLFSHQGPCGVFRPIIYEQITL